MLVNLHRVFSGTLRAYVLREEEKSWSDTPSTILLLGIYVIFRMITTNTTANNNNYIMVEN